MYVIIIKCGQQLRLMIDSMAIHCVLRQPPLLLRVGVVSLVSTARTYNFVIFTAYSMAAV